MLKTHIHNKCIIVVMGQNNGLTPHWLWASSGWIVMDYANLHVDYLDYRSRRNWIGLWLSRKSSLRNGTSTGNFYNTVSNLCMLVCCYIAK